MARKNKFKYINERLTTAQKKKYSEWLDKNEGQLGTLIEECLEDGYRISLALLMDEQSIRAMMTTPDKKHINYNKGLQGWSRDPIQALTVMLYKHVVLYESDVWGSEDTDDDWG